MLTNRRISKLFLTVMFCCFLNQGQVSAGVLDLYNTYNKTSIYGQFDSATRKFNRGEFEASEAQIAATLLQYSSQKKDDKSWLAKANFLSARVKSSLKREDDKDKDDIRKFYTASYALFKEVEEGDAVVKDNLAEVIFFKTEYLLSLPASKRHDEDAKFIEALPTHMDLKMSNDWNVKLGLIQAKLDEEGKQPLEARKTLLKFVERMPTKSPEKAHVYGRIGKFFEEEKNLKEASDYYTRAHTIYTSSGEAAQAGRIAYALHKVELYRGAYKNAKNYALESIAWIEVNEKLAAQRAKAEEERRKEEAKRLGEEAQHVANTSESSSSSSAGAIASVWDPRGIGADKTTAAQKVKVTKEQVAEEFEVQNKILATLNKGEAELILASDSTTFNEARQTFETVGALIDQKVKEFREQHGGLAASSINSAPPVGKSDAERKMLLQLNVYKLLSLIGEARAQIPVSPSSARTRLDHAIDKFLLHIDPLYKHYDALQSLIHSTFWQIGMRENVGKDESAFLSLTPALQASHALPQDHHNIAEKVNQNTFEIFDARVMWKVYFVQAQLALLSQDTTKALERAEKAQKLAEDKGFLHFAAKTHDLIALAKKLQADKKEVERGEAKKAVATTEQDKAATVGGMKKDVDALRKASADALAKAVELRNSCGLLYSWTGGALGYTLLDEKGIV